MKPIIFFLGIMLGIWLVATHPDIAQSVWDFGVSALDFIIDGIAKLSER